MVKRNPEDVFYKAHSSQSDTCNTTSRIHSVFIHGVLEHLKYQFARICAGIRHMEPNIPHTFPEERSHEGPTVQKDQQ